MKAISSLVVTLCTFATAFGQDAIQLGQTSPIDLKVSNVNWHPMGKRLIYMRDLEEGVGLGVYSEGKFAGKVVLNLGKTSTHTIDWFQNQPSALVMVHSEVQGQPASTQVQIYIVDADAQTAKPVFSEVYENKFLPNFEIDTSPLLKHAIVKLSLNEDVRHLVLCQNASALVNSSDLDRAEKQGLQGPSWSIDGTAVYGKFTGTNAINISGVTFTLTDSGVAGSNAETEVVRGRVISTIALEKSVSNEGVLELRVSKSRPVPETGSSVLELMPSNPVLRPVRFRGAWESKSKALLPMSPKNHPIMLTFGKSSQQDSSVWLRRGVDPSEPATLLAVHASRVWIDSTQTSVVYLIDGALFFRPIL